MKPLEFLYYQIYGARCVGKYPVGDLMFIALDKPVHLQGTDKFVMYVLETAF